MNKTFTLGAVTGVTALAVGFPLAATLVGAQEAQESSAPTTTVERPFFEKRTFTQEDIQTMIDRDNSFLSNIDAFVSIQKEAVQNHRIALQAAADIDDDTARQEAVKAAHETMRSEVQEAIEANPDLEGMKFGIGFGPGKGPHGPGMHGDMHGMLEEKLGMTSDELKAALDAGKTIEEIAAEKGIELPERPMMHRMRQQ